MLIIGRRGRPVTSRTFWSTPIWRDGRSRQRLRRDEGRASARRPGAAAGHNYKRAFFVDWRVADRWKRPLIARWDFVLDTNNPAEPKLADGDAVRARLARRR